MTDTPELAPKWSQKLTDNDPHPVDTSHLPTTGPALIIFQGLPGSGKTTTANKLLAQHPNTYRRISRDHLRHMLFNTGFIPSHPYDREALVTRIQLNAIDILLDHGYAVIVDDTNLHRAHLEGMLRWIHAVYRQDIHLVNFLTVPIETCIERDAQRPEAEQVGADTIHAMHQRWLETQTPTT